MLVFCSLILWVPGSVEATPDGPVCSETSCTGRIALGSSLNACEGISSHCFQKPAGFSSTCSSVAEGAEQTCYHLVYPDAPPGTLIRQLPDEVRFVGEPHPSTRNLGSTVMVFGYFGVVDHPFELVWVYK